MKYFLMKIRDAALVLWGVASLIFFLFNILPGDPARMMLDQREDSAQLAAIRAKYAFDQPVLLRYAFFLNDLSPLSFHAANPQHYTHAAPGKYGGLALFDGPVVQVLIKAPYLGESFQRQGKKVGTILSETLPNTMILAVSAIILAMFIGIGIGIVAAIKKDSFFDRFWTVFGTFGMALPSFFSAVLVAWLFGFVWAPITGLSMTGNLWELDDFGEGLELRLKNLILPAFTLGIRPLAVIIQLTRSSMLEVLQADYIRTARAKGLPQSTILIKHALRNALNPVVTAVSGWFASMLAGAVFVEYIFGWNGVGKQIVEALNTLDLPVVTGAVLTVAFLFVVIQFFVDMLYAVLDPRLR